MKNALLSLLGIIFIGGSIYLFLQQPVPEHLREKVLPQEEIGKKPGKIIIKIGDHELWAEVASTDTMRTMGLSGREFLPEGEGMLFIFPEPGPYGIWMKDMSFPIDIIWFNEAKEIIHIEKNVNPDTYPTVFYPPTPAKYVLEVPSGSSDRLLVDTGDILYFDY